MFLQLLNTERLTIFATDLRVCFLLFESQRTCLKFQLEYYLNKLSEIIGSENPRTPYEMRELALDNLLQLLRIPSFSAEIYINYDCNLYCTNLLEDLVKLLSKNALSATQTIYTLHQISLDGLLTIVADIERHCAIAKTDVYHAEEKLATVSLRGGDENSGAIGDEHIVSEQQTKKQNTASVSGMTSGGEESSGGVENIANYIAMDAINDKKDGGGVFINIGAVRRSSARAAVKRVTAEQLTTIKNKKQVIVDPKRVVGIRNIVCVN